MFSGKLIKSLNHLVVKSLSVLFLSVCWVNSACRQEFLVSDIQKSDTNDERIDEG